MKTSDSFKLFGIQFAPLIIPFKRRIETFAVGFWITTFLFLGFISHTILFILALTPYRWIAIFYLTWCVYDWKTPYTGGRTNK